MSLPSLFLSTSLPDVAGSSAENGAPACIVHLCRHYTWVPDALWKEERKADYLHLTESVPDDEIILSEPVPDIGAVVVFSAPASLYRLGKKRLPKAVWTSHIGTLGASLVRLSREKKENIGVFVSQGQVDIWVARGGNLLFGNSFPVTAPVDVLYYGLKAAGPYVAQGTVYYGAETVETAIQTCVLLESRFPRVVAWKSVDEVPIFRLWPCE